MTDLPSIAGTTVALALPWLLGCAFMTRLLQQSPQRNYQIIVGHGYFAGLFLTTLIIRAWDFIGLPLQFWAIAAVMALLTAGIHHSWRNQPKASASVSASQDSPHWQLIISCLLMALIIYRYCGLAQEIWLRPLYPWDAWMNWAPKAVTWYHLQELAPYISPADWLKGTDNGLAYTTGAGNAWKYPVTVPLIQLWGMLGAGSSDQNFSNLPWLLAPLAFGLALYGHLRLLGASILTSTTACYVLLSVPYISVHSALAGYADIWLALAFGAASISLHEWQRNGDWPWGALSVFFAFACTQLKLPGLVLGAIVLAVFLISLLKLGARAWLAIAVAVTATIVYVVLLGISIDIPSAGLIEISAKRIAVPYLGTFELAYRPVHSALVETLFSMWNWNLLWYLSVGLLLFKLYQKDFLQPPSLELQCLSLLLAFLLFIFYFTHFSMFVIDYTTVNRVLLYAIPTMVFYMFKTLHEKSGSSGYPTPVES